MGRGNRYTGGSGETAAVEFLKKKGYRIRQTNFRTPFGEIDIVADLGPSLVFVEVKTRITYSLGPPYLSVTRLKQKHIVKNALYYLVRHNLSDSPWRVDVVSVKLDCEYRIENIELIENVVEDNG